MRSAFLLLPLAVAACGGSGQQSIPVSKEQAQQEAVCRQVAYQDPQVKAAIAAAIPGTYYNFFNKVPDTRYMDQQEAIQNATMDCMRRRGYIQPGGVEPVKKYPFSPLGF